VRFSTISLGLTFLLLVGCASTKRAVKNTEELTAIDHEVRKLAAGSGPITLLDHQLIPIDYLHKHPEIKGLLVNHYMGTGKTYLGIGFAQSYPDRPVIVLAPKFLENQWLNSIRHYGVKNPERFIFVSYDDAPEKLSNLDVSQHILLADEVHNLVKRMRAIDANENSRYTKVYTNLRNAYKILGLTGTPIYGDESDIAFVLNLVSGKELMPFNQESFRLKYTKILSTRQFFRGYFTESMLMSALLPASLPLFLMAVMGPIGLALGLPIGVFSIVGANWIFNLNSFKLRKLDVDKMQPSLSQYVSYFRFRDSHFADFPAQDFKLMEVPYNKQQYSFFLRLVEGDLPVAELQRLLKNEPVQHDDEYVRINSTNIHKQIYSAVGAGRDIGNFDFTEKDGTVTEAPKFVRIYDELVKNNEQTVIYSNYYHTGILAFRDFLLRQGYGGKFAIVEPTMSVKEVSALVDAFNKGETKLLLLHPDITEGLSLKGTQYLDIMEPMVNSTVMEQVIGRTRRFRSHSHLPKDKQRVVVRLWQSTSSTWNPSLSNINRANWWKRYRELSYLAGWGYGLWQVDKNIDKKALNPEELAWLKLKTLEKNFAEMQALLTHDSIENRYAGPLP